MNLTDPETRLVCALLHEYRLNLLRQMRDPSKQLTDAGREAYWRDIATAESAAEKLEPRVPQLRAV